MIFHFPIPPGSFSLFFKKKWRIKSVMLGIFQAGSLIKQGMDKTPVFTYADVLPLMGKLYE